MINIFGRPFFFSKDTLKDTTRKNANYVNCIWDKQMSPTSDQSYQIMLLCLIFILQNKSTGCRWLSVKDHGVLHAYGDKHTRLMTNPPILYFENLTSYHKMKFFHLSIIPIIPGNGLNNMVV